MKAFNSTLRPGKGLQRKTTLQSTKPMQRSAMKRTAPKKRAGHAKTYLEACRGELCFIRIPGACIGGVDTTVPAHSNQQIHGKGMGLKAHDRFTVPACHACHAEIDQGSRFTREEKFSLWDAAYARWEPVREKKLNAKPAANGGQEKTRVGARVSKTLIGDLYA